MTFSRSVRTLLLSVIALLVLGTGALPSPAVSLDPVASSTAPQRRELTVYVTRTGKKYHRDGCRYLSKSRIPVPLSEAKRRFSACSVCRPPQ